jgi:hypothetical protein
MRSASSASVSLRNGSLSDKDFDLVDNWRDGFDKYNQLVTNQVSKDVAYKSEDFMKICKILTKKKDVGGNFVHGLPEAVLDLALLWCPAEKMLRKPFGCAEPSWSWMGWEGAVNFPFDPNNCPDIRRVEGNYLISEIQRFSVGPASDPYTVRREKKHRLRIGFKNDDSGIPWRGVKPPSEESNTLRFRAWAIPAENFYSWQLTDELKAEIACTELSCTENADGTPGPACGVIMDYKDLIDIPVTEEACTFEFVLLSRSRRCEDKAVISDSAPNTAHLSGTPVWRGDHFDRSKQIEDFDEKVYPKGEWNMLNVMLVQHFKEGYAERVSIARIHEDVWKARKPAQKDFVLK